MTKIKYLLFSSILTLSLLMPFTVSAASINIASTTIDNPVLRCADKIDWQYKAINGILHKRLFNFTTGVALTDWEPVT